MQLWFPRSERGRIQGTTHFFSRFAVAVTPFVAGSIMLAFGWRAIFYIFGSLGVIWAIAFSFFYRNLPEEHKSVNRRGACSDPRLEPRWYGSGANYNTAVRSVEDDLRVAQHVVHLPGLQLFLFWN